MKESLSALNSREQFRVGDRVLLDKFYGATIKHFGPVSFASGNWAGLLLDEPKGKNNGTVAGKRYFESPPKHGIFTKQSRITKQPEFKPGDRVVVQKQYVGTVRFVGDSHIGPGQWIGVELRNATGRNDGSRDGNRYFTCEPGHGIFTRARNVDPAISTADYSPKSLSDSIISRNFMTAIDGDRPRDGTETEHDLEQLVSENTALRTQVSSLQEDLASERQRAGELSALPPPAPLSSEPGDAVEQLTLQLTEVHQHMAEEQERAQDLAVQLESARSIARDAMAFQDQTHGLLMAARQRLEMTHGRIDDLEIAIDMHVAEKEEYKEQFNDTSDRLAAVQMDMLDARGDFMEQLAETDALRFETDRLRELLQHHGISTDMPLPQQVNPLDTVEALLAKCSATPGGRAAASRIAGVEVQEGRLVVQGQGDLASVAAQLEDAYHSRTVSPPTQDSSLVATRQDSLEDLDETLVEELSPAEGDGDDDDDGDDDGGDGDAGTPSRPTPPPGEDPDNYCDVCEVYGHTSEECDDTITF